MSRAPKRRPKNLRVVAFKPPQPNEEPDRLTNEEWKLIDRFRELDSYEAEDATPELLTRDELELLQNYRTLTNHQRMYFEASISIEVNRNVQNAIARAQQQQLPPKGGAR